MTDRDALLRSILERPDDDVRRLVMADFLEENGEGERAAWIRSQIEKPAITAFPEGKSAIMAVYREPSRKSGPVNLGDARLIVVAPAIPGIAWETSKGFVSSVRCTLANWVGGPCERCNGDGFTTSDQSMKCRPCNATGRTHGHGPRIVAEQPVERGDHRIPTLDLPRPRGLDAARLLRLRRGREDPVRPMLSRRWSDLPHRRGAGLPVTLSRSVL